MLYPFQAPRQRAERFIALGRLALASFSLLAIWLDPSEPAEYAALTYTLLAGYLAYAVIVVVLVMAAERSVERLGAAFHVVDIALFTTFIALTQGPTSPFFVYFVFALLAAALRWQWQGVAWTALAILAIYLGLGLYAQQVLRDPAFQLNRFIIRSVYLAVVAVLVGYLSAYEQQRRAELAKLAAWPRHVPQASLIEAALRQAAAILGGTRLLMLWEEAEEPWRYRATLEGDSFTSERMSAEPAPLVAEPLAAADFLCLDPAGPAPTVLHTAGAGVQRWHGPPLAAGVAPPEAGSILALRLQGEQVEGRLFCFGKPGRSVDDLALGRIVARQIAADLDQFVVQQRLHQALVSEERVRFARELHDGVLQSLTGLALQLEVVKRLLATDPATARARLSEIQDLVAAEQGDLRFFVNQMRPLPHAHLEVNTSLRAYLAELCGRAERQWGLTVALKLGALARPLSEILAHAVYRIVQEALANAARHGAANTVRVTLDTADDRLQLVIADDGRGFGFTGRHDLAALTQRRLGPESIKQRVAALDGALVIDSSARGARLEITLPLRPTLRLVAAGEGRPPATGGDDVARAG